LGGRGEIASAKNFSLIPSRRSWAFAGKIFVRALGAGEMARVAAFSTLVHWATSSERKLNCFAFFFVYFFEQGRAAK